MNRLFVVLSALVLSAPALARTNAAAFRGALVSAESIEQPTPTRAHLEAQVAQLESTRPGIGGPVALVSVGGGLFVGGAVLLWGGLVDLIVLGSRGTYALIGYVLLACGAALAIAGGVMLAVGLVKLFERLAERRAITQRIDELKARLQSPDPTPPAWPETGLIDVPPHYVLMTF